MPEAIIVVEGILSLAVPELRDLFDLTVFVDVAEEIRLARRLHRDLTERGRTRDSIVAQFEGSVRPMHREFVEPGKALADLVLQDGDAAQDKALVARAQRELTARLEKKP